MRCSRLRDQRFKGLDWPSFHSDDHPNVSPSTRSPNLSLLSLIPHNMFRVSTNRPSVDQPNWSGDAEWPGRFCNPVTAMQGTKHFFCSFAHSRSIVYLRRGCSYGYHSSPHGSEHEIDLSRRPVHVYPLCVKLGSVLLLV
jgi:hypothetical protein